MSEVQQLKDELASLKEMFKKKCEKLKKANEKISYLSILRKDIDAWSHRRNLEHQIFIDFTGHLDKFFYKVFYEYKNKPYIENDVQSFGTKWIKRSLLIHLAIDRDLIIFDHEIKIIKAEKLW